MMLTSLCLAEIGTVFLSPSTPQPTVERLFEELKDCRFYCISYELDKLEVKVVQNKSVQDSFSAQTNEGEFAYVMSTSGSTGFPQPVVVTNSVR